MDKYSLQRELEASWRAMLTQPEKLTVDRIIGAGEDARLAYGIDMCTHILELSILFATRTEVEGQTFLYNESSHKSYILPIIDYTVLLDCILLLMKCKRHPLHQCK